MNTDYITAAVCCSPAYLPLVAASVIIVQQITRSEMVVLQSHYLMYGKLSEQLSEQLVIGNFSWMPYRNDVPLPPRLTSPVHRNPPQYLRSLTMITMIPCSLTDVKIGPGLSPAMPWSDIPRDTSMRRRPPPTKSDLWATRGPVGHPYVLECFLDRSHQVAVTQETRFPSRSCLIYRINDRDCSALSDLV